MELFGVAISVEILQALAGAGGAILVAWRGRRVKKALEAMAQLANNISRGRSETSPGGQKYTQEEMEGIIDDASRALKSLSPLLTRFFAKK